jgi:PKD repeat protein
MAAPHVTGTLALMAAADPSVSAMQLKQILLASVEPIVALQGKTVTGGILDAAAALNAINPPENLWPISSFTSDISTGESPLTVQFSDYSSDPDGGQIVGWLWDFDDGAISNEQSPSHTFTALGSYRVTLTVTDDDLATGSSSQVVSVISSPSEPPAAPSSLRATVKWEGKGRNRVITSVTLNWVDNSDNEAGFVVEACVTTGKGKNKTCHFEEIGSPVANTTSYHFIYGGDNSPDYDRFRVKAVNYNAPSAYSNVVHI